MSNEDCLPTKHRIMQPSYLLKHIRAALISANSFRRESLVVNFSRRFKRLSEFAVPKYPQTHPIS
jgi:hypothetical protein